jgi:hypothetical protein
MVTLLPARMPDDGGDARQYVFDGMVEFGDK